MGLLFMYALYSALLAFFLLLTLPYWLLQMMRHGKYRAGLRQRFGAVPPALAGRCERRHDLGSRGFGGRGCGFERGRRGAAAEIPVPSRNDFDDHQHRAETRRAPFWRGERVLFPLDFAFAVRPYLDALRPELVVVAETEFWPNFSGLPSAAGRASP
jgi:3-deoxy-D-manno-octulosonic-acid transferase